MLRVRTTTGTIVIKDVHPSITFSDLKKIIEQKTNIITARQKIKMGFPPKLIEDQESITVGDLKINSGETLIVEESEELLLTNNGTIQQLTPKYYSNIPPQPSSATSNITQDAGDMLRRVIPSDNSCLFNAVSYSLEGPNYKTLPRAKSLRQVIADVVKNDPITFDEATLGQNPKEYCNWIKKTDSWGGAIELMILSKFYNIEICAHDIQTCRVDRYGQDLTDCNIKIYLLYDGIHYDSMALNPIKDGPEDIDITLFNKEDTVSDDKAAQYVKAAHQRHEFTNVSEFDLRCLVCQKGLRGETEAREHAKSTGHVNFGEYKK
ncbi:ubiquitin thioesterase [Acrasis kona]|uniref:Ubiquitin thioesterase OTU n=1 Tax=Acrasis kona TaxID=1008807 RepID=A0AAW2Z6M0_9EUKA